MSSKHTAQAKERANELSREVIGAAIEVHKVLGPGLLENAYQVSLCHELTLRRIPFKPQLDLPLNYKGIMLDCAYRLDILVDDLVLLELKAVERMESVFEAQLITYLKLSGLWLGLLMNFNVPVLRDGIKRIVYD
jgi:GxxExxY protein